VSGSDTAELAAPATERRLTSGRLLLLAGALLAATAAVMIGCSLVGVYSLTWDVWLFRMERMAVAALAGASLAVGGMAMQGLLRNPLAEPYILGISSGAGVGVMAGLVLMERTAVSVLPAWATTPVLAVAGALATCAVVYGIAQRRGRLNPYVLLLAGVIVNVLNGAVMMAMEMLLSPDRLLTYIRWGMGSLPNDTNVVLLGICAGIIVAGWAVLLLRGAWLNVLGLGDDVAASSGVRVHWLRLETFVVVAAMTSAAVSLAGPIGFVGLIVPHLCRMVLGPDHRMLAVASGFVGAMMLMLADTAGQLAGYFLRQSEIPVGVVMALAGGPFFIVLLRRRFREATT
jgi:iron complex transport system permease protein